MPLQIIYVKTTTHDLPIGLQVSISSVVQRYKTAEAHVKKLNEVAKKRGVNATYELSDKSAYVEHWAKVRAQTGG